MGPGGFINISQCAKKVVFCGTFTAGGFKVATGDGKLTILQEGRTKKFLDKVEQITYSGAYAARTAQEVLFVTERAVCPRRWRARSSPRLRDRRQIVGGIVDGPLDLDAAVDAEAAKVKNVDSPVAGDADILIAPNIEAGNMVYKDLAFIANSQIAGIVVGAKVPVILTSRADSVATRRFSAAAAVLYAQGLARDLSILFPEVAE
jgi:hypothetical protein